MSAKDPFGPYDRGDRCRVGNHSGDTRAPFKNAAGDDVDPTEVTLRIKPPDSTVLVYRWPTPEAGELQLQKEAGATGRFYADHTWDAAGTYRCRLEGTGAVVTADEWAVFVRSSAIL